MKYYLGIDVGTGSARAGLFDENGALLATAKHDIKTPAGRNKARRTSGRPSAMPCAKPSPPPPCPATP